MILENCTIIHVNHVGIDCILCAVCQDTSLCVCMMVLRKENLLDLLVQRINKTLYIN